MTDTRVLLHTGQLVANEGQRRLVSAEAWSLFQKYFPNAPVFEALSDPCQLCVVRSLGCCTPTVQVVWGAALPLFKWSGVLHSHCSSGLECIHSR